MDLDFPFKSVSSNPIMFHCKGHGISNFKKLPLGVGTFHKKKNTESRLQVVISVGQGHWYFGYLAIFIKII